MAGTYYGDYLNLNQLLSSQNPLSKKNGNESHDETLFIIVHQVYELWFKQILHELVSIRDVFTSDNIEERSLHSVNERLERIIKIQKLLVDQLPVMETMTPMDFLEFRDLLVPASGFQSIQFRQIEVLMGLPTGKRGKVDRSYFMGRLSEKDQAVLNEVESQASLFDGLEKWLERIPFTKEKNFDFWNSYKVTVEEMLQNEENILLKNLATLPEIAKEAQIEGLESTKKTFASLFDPKQFEKLTKAGKRRLSQKATLNALFILLYRDEPILHQPYRLLNLLMDIDENFTSWRQRHAIMAQRMLGTKVGTGGSSGHEYLKMAAEKNRVYLDLFNLSTFLIPRSKLPILPKELKKQLNFYIAEENTSEL
ncbi:MAG: tryptophan 2,3-dioxygenase [Bdellovibrionales bacterium CG12_big_fil_rev_8_21_14_0_65_38_15]|nr:MAG: tryptophan 2,3-dioxygenase [Bdellovibrionales bacterium CG22_combo_CG10-13_8_21_14_all_38_13]PIQ57293.1 MAG: tryptophan 2,3-dioxygenase [Bdellovibrionales bacterium CG12_big_fil_rev_8_21_14_0_65_38_15]PIR28839.1 MAG: tryptophan 2,3-dioxygenase [Bdellovibrionales bacterium CG11_big_fil_rev_8_21_14_0_20_38_13]